jgi:aminoglycoside phosphotransferase (APT) family kinase protein
MTALAGIHRVDWRSKCGYLGEFWGFEFDVTRWDRFYERAADQHLLELQPRVRKLLLDTIPANAHVGLYHGDFQFSNTMFSPSGDLLAVIDWELTGIGATLNDVGWVSVFARTEPWPAGARGNIIVHGDELEAMYAEAWEAPLEGLAWFKALALYKFGIITGFNLMLHRRGKRHDPHWEEIGPGMQTNMEYAMGLLSR